MNIEYEKEGNKLMKQEDAPSAEANKFYSQVCTKMITIQLSCISDKNINNNKWSTNLENSEGSLATYNVLLCVLRPCIYI